MAHFEWGVFLADEGEACDSTHPHRAGMTEEGARAWILECVEMGTNPGLFVVARRPIGDWMIGEEAMRNPWFGR